MYIIFSTLFGLIQINHTATDIAIYKEIHTGANTHSGGLNEGLTIVEYQGSYKDMLLNFPKQKLQRQE